ncbi:MAG TPA: hypothetical protein DHW45_18215 [Candidatus Latescibacteria bacterium]|nr:hypothetical protein [Candidatus Latescibacterota bacterium]
MSKAATNICILPIHQNRGYETQLIQEASSKSKRTGRSVKLQVLEINPARSFMRDSLLSSLEETGPIT